MNAQTHPAWVIYIYGSILSLSKINSQTHTKSKSTDKKPYIHPEIGGGYVKKGNAIRVCKENID